MRALIQKHPLLWAYLFVAFFSLSYQIPIYVTGTSGSTGLRQTLLMSFMWLIPLLILPRQTRSILAITGLLMWPAGVTSLLYLMIYGQEFSQSTIFIAFESNLAEGSEFIQSYWHWSFIPLIAAYALIPIWMWRNAKPLEMTSRQRITYAMVFSVISFWPFIGTRLLAAHTDINDAIYHQIIRMEPAAPWNIGFGYLKYREQVTEMNRLLDINQQLPPLQHMTMETETLPDTVVLVLGESTNRQRMSLYGYQRPTTPKLDALKESGELLVFTDVVTPRPYTIEALQQALSFADSQHPNLFFEQPTLLNMMKQAGYDITWITNQQTQTRRNTMLTTFSQLADHPIYLNNNRQQNASQYDESVLLPFHEALQSQAAKKLIVVHLLGTHRVYRYRYPASFAQFNEQRDVPEWIGEEQLEEYNSYDDAIRYNDSVVANLIEQTRQVEDSSLFIYFSDHGEEVFDNPDDLFTGRNEAAPTEAMYTVPFVVWASEQFQQNHAMQRWHEAQQRPYSTADFIHTFADMVGLHFDNLRPEASLISRHFIPQPRWIGDPRLPKTLRDYSSLESNSQRQVTHRPHAAVDEAHL